MPPHELTSLSIFLFFLIFSCFGYQSLDLLRLLFQTAYICIMTAVFSHEPCAAMIVTTFSQSHVEQDWYRLVMSCEGKLKVRFKYHGSFESRLCASPRFEIFTSIFSYSGSKPRLLLVFISTLWLRCHVNSSIPRCLNNQTTDTRQENNHWSIR